MNLEIPNFALTKCNPINNTMTPVYHKIRASESQRGHNGCQKVAMTATAPVASDRKIWST